MTATRVFINTIIRSRERFCSVNLVMALHTGKLIGSVKQVGPRLEQVLISRIHISAYFSSFAKDHSLALIAAATGELQPTCTRSKEQVIQSRWASAYLLHFIFWRGLGISRP
jgi:hypothetical protein